MGAFMVIKGAKKIERKLEKMGRTSGRKFIKKALVETNKEVVLPAVKRSATTRVGGEMGRLIAKHTKRRAFKKAKKGNAVDVVDISAKGNDDFVVVTKDGKRKYIPFAIEFGHGSVKPNPFLRAAWREAHGRAQKLLGKKIVDGVLNAARKA